MIVSEVSGYTDALCLAMTCSLFRVLMTPYICKILYNEIQPLWANTPLICVSEGVIGSGFGLARGEAPPGEVVEWPRLSKQRWKYEQLGPPKKRKFYLRGIEERMREMCEWRLEGLVWCDNPPQSIRITRSKRKKLPLGDEDKIYERRMKTALVRDEEEMRVVDHRFRQLLDAQGNLKSGEKVDELLPPGVRWVKPFLTPHYSLLPQMFPTQQQEWILRNHTKKEYIPAASLPTTIDLGIVLISQILWLPKNLAQQAMEMSIDGAGKGQISCLRGEWAGGRHDIIADGEWKGREGWTDVGEKVGEKVKGMIEAARGGCLRWAPRRGWARSG